MEHLREILVREMKDHSDRLRYEATQGDLDVEVVFGEEPGEMCYLYFVDQDDLYQAVKEAIEHILGPEARIYNVFKKGTSVFFKLFLCA